MLLEKWKKEMLLSKGTLKAQKKLKKLETILPNLIFYSFEELLFSWLFFYDFEITPYSLHFQQWLQFSLINLGIHNWTRMFWHIIASWISVSKCIWPDPHVEFIWKCSHYYSTKTSWYIVELKKVAWYLINWRKYHPLESVETQWL